MYGPPVGLTNSTPEKPAGNRQRKKLWWPFIGPSYSAPREVETARRSENLAAECIAIYVARNALVPRPRLYGVAARMEATTAAEHLSSNNE